MKYLLPVIMFLFLGVNFYGQNGFEKATFKKGDVTEVISEKFYALNKDNSIGAEFIIISFDLTEQRMLSNVKPEIFNNKKT